VPLIHGFTLRPSSFTTRLAYTMLGVEGYGSDSDSDTETQVSATTPAATLTKTGLTLPPPASGSKTSSSLGLPPPKKKAPKKIAIGLPSLSNDDNDHDDTLNDGPPAKKPRIEPGGGSSTLFSMLPAPKNKNPVPERVLGSGKGRGLVFNTGTKRPATQATVEDVEEEPAHSNVAPLSSSILEEDITAKEREKPQPSAVPFLPSSVARGKANVSTEDRPTVYKAPPTKHAAPAVDFFSLGAYRFL
jgi:proline-rich protein PRCC